MEYSVNIPLSRFKREVRQWLRNVEKEECVVNVTRNKKVVAYLVPVNKYNKLAGDRCM